jgi:hypothetical protein
LSGAIKLPAANTLTEDLAPDWAEITTSVANRAAMNVVIAMMNSRMSSGVSDGHPALTQVLAGEGNARRIVIGRRQPTPTRRLYPERDGQISGSVTRVRRATTRCSTNTNGNDGTGR